MRNAIIVIIVLVAGWFAWRHFSSGAGATPSVADIEPAVRSYVEADAARHCAGTSSVEDLRITSVGAYIEGAGGFPVYGGLTRRCDANGTTTTVSGDANASAPFVYVRGGKGSYEAFIPAMFEQANKEMQEALDKAVDSSQQR